MKTKLLLSTLLICSAMVSFGQSAWYYTNLSEPKSAMGTVSLGSKAIFAGGSNVTGYLSLVEVYDVNTGLWDSLGHLSVPRGYSRGVVCGSKILFAGGFDWTQTYATVDMYDTLTRQWTDTVLSASRHSMAGVSNGTMALFAGGFQYPSTTFKKTVDIYDSQTGQWSVTYLSQPREGIAAAVVGDLAIFAGGNNANVTTTDVVDIYHFSTKTWDVKNLSQARSHAMITTIGDKVIIAGGVTGIGNPTNRVDIYDVSSGTWDTASLSFPRSLYGGFAATVNGKAYFAGGGVFLGNGFQWPSDVIDIYDPADNSWSTKNLSEPLLDHSVLGIGRLLIAAGGENDQGDFVSTVEILDVMDGIPQNNKDDANLSIYPNPGSGKIHLDLSDRYNNKAVLANIYNLQGQLVFTKVMRPALRVLNLDLPIGMFILKVMADDTIFTKLITIQ